MANVQMTAFQAQMVKFQSGPVMEVIHPVTVKVQFVLAQSVPPNVWETEFGEAGQYGLPKSVTIKLDPAVTSIARVHEVLLMFLRGGCDKAADKYAMGYQRAAGTITWEPSIEKLSFEGNTFERESMLAKTGVTDGDELQLKLIMNQTAVNPEMLEALGLKGCECTIM